MFQRAKYLTIVLVLLLVAPVSVPDGVWANEAISPPSAKKHHVDIEASVICLEDSLVLNYTATAWEGYFGDPSSRENPEVYIVLNATEVLVAGAFTAANGYMLSGSVPLPATISPGETFTIGAYAWGTWGDGFPGGQSASISLVAPTEPCGGDQVGTGRFTGGGHQIRVDGVRVTRGLTIHCDLLLSNNLEVNWQGNQFHMTEHLTTVACTDDPLIIQFPPEAPLDTLVGVGTGRYNNTPGFTIEFTLVDYGEPGAGNDQMAILIYETANPINVVLDVPLQVISGGNLQAHYDQPHK